MAEIKNDKKNKYISYIKGFAFLCILLIHLFSWGGAGDNTFYLYFKRIFYSGLSILFFVSMSGALIYLAYGDYDLRKSTKRLITRGLKLIGIYYLYNIIKLFLFDFSKEPLYSNFIGSNRMNDLVDILTLKKSVSGIPILFTIGFFLLISPIFLYIIKKTKHPKTNITLTLAVFILLSFVVQPNGTYIFNLLYSNNFATFPMFLWIIPYLLGMLLSMVGFEKKKKEVFIVSSISTAVSALYLFILGKTLNPAIYAYQQGGVVKYYLYFVCFSFLILSVLIYLFYFIKNSNNKFPHKILDILEFVGDRTFNIYLIQWLLIDLTYLFFNKNTWLIFITVPVGIAIFLLRDRKKQ